MARGRATFGRNSYDGDDDDSWPAYTRTYVDGDVKHARARRLPEINFRPSSKNSVRRLYVNFFFTCAATR